MSAPNGWTVELITQAENPFFWLRWDSKESPEFDIQPGQENGEFSVHLPRPDSRYLFGRYDLVLRDLTHVSGQVQAGALQVGGDLDGDSLVTCSDIAILKRSFGLKAGTPEFDPFADVNSDRAIDVRDLAYVTSKLPSGTKCP